MLVYAGIDEAGYGPMLGPLCVASSVFVLEGGDASAGAPNLWRSLGSVVCRSRRDRRRRIAVDDSKKLKGQSSGAAHPLKHLERGVLSFIGATDASIPADCSAFLEHLGATVAEEPWYASRTPLPVGQEPEALRIDVSRLRRALGKSGVRCAGIACEVIDAADFNRGVDRMGNKANVNFGAVLRLIEAVWSAWPEAHPRVIVDRQGGRTHYRTELQPAFPDARLRIVAESEEISRYEMTRGADSRITVSFLRDSEERHLPVALASMTAKYARELLMLRLNRFFALHRPEIKPTAGYVEDARRYLAEIEPVIRELGIERPCLIRSV